MFTPVIFLAMRAKVPSVIAAAGDSFTGMVTPFWRIGYKRAVVIVVAQLSMEWTCKRRDNISRAAFLFVDTVQISSFCENGPEIS